MPRNFYPGPCALPPPVLARIRDELPDYQGTGMSILEISHRARPVTDLIEETLERLRRALTLPDDFEIMLLQGGGTLQFAMAPLNFARPGERIDYVDSGIWAAKAIAEAQRFDRDVAVVASTAPDYRTVPTEIRTRPGARYLHLCSNNTIVGTQFHTLPTAPVPVVADLSSDILGIERDHATLGCFYAHAQKSFGAAGVTIVAMRRDMLDHVPDGLPSMLDYRVHRQHRSNYNTPPVFAIYVVGLVLDWLENEIGGVAAMAQINRAKAACLYNVFDTSNFYSCPVEPASRSWMNVVFRLPTPELESRFVAEADGAGLIGLAGHRSRGGCRASLYNAVTLADTEALAEFLCDFEQRNG